MPSRSSWAGTRACIAAPASSHAPRPPPTRARASRSAASSTPATTTRWSSPEHDRLDQPAGRHPAGGHARRGLRRRAPRQPAAVEADRRALPAGARSRRPTCPRGAQPPSASCRTATTRTWSRSTGASNVTGEIWPLAEIARVAHDNGARLLVDAAQLAPHAPIDMQRDGIDFLAMSGAQAVRAVRRRGADRRVRLAQLRRPVPRGRGR